MIETNYELLKTNAEHMCNTLSLMNKINPLSDDQKALFSDYGLIRRDDAGVDVKVEDYFQKMVDATGAFFVYAHETIGKIESSENITSSQVVNIYNLTGLLAGSHSRISEDDVGNDELSNLLLADSVVYTSIVADFYRQFQTLFHEERSLQK